MHFLGVDREPMGERSKSLLVAATKSFTVGQPQEFSQMSALSAPSARPPRGVSRDRVSFNTLLKDLLYRGDDPAGSDSTR